MGTPGRRAKPSLKSWLFEKTTRFEFFQAVRLLRRVRRGRLGVGRDSDPTKEMVRFRSNLSYAFPTSDVASLEESDGSKPDEMVVNFIGVATPSSFGSLPTPYVEELRRQLQQKQPAMRDFFDLFNHRLISLFYRSWERTRPDVLHELGEHSPFESALLATLGLEGERIPERLPFPKHELLARAGLLAMRPASTSAICGLIASYLGIPAKIEQFLPCWYEIDDPDRTRLGLANSALGDDINLGSEVCMVQSRFRIRLGPMGFDTYQALLPGSEAYDKLAAMVRVATGVEFDFEFTLVLDRNEVPRLRLASASAQETAEDQTRLGWSTWIRNEEFARDADEAVFTPSLAHEEARDTLEMRI